MKKWLSDILYYSFIWFFYVLFFSVIIISPFLILNGGTADILRDYSNPKFILVFQVPILIATILVGKIITKSKIISFFNFTAGHIIWGIAIGVLLIGIFVIQQILFKTTAFLWTGLPSNLLVSFSMYILVAINEELLFRHLLFSHLVKRLNIMNSIIICSLIFGLTHIGNDNFSALGFVNISLFGVLMSLFYLKHKNLSMPIGVHFSWNFLQGPIFGYGVSGYMDDSFFKADVSNYKHYINGGKFGAEGSLFLIPIIIAAIYFVWKFSLDKNNKNSNRELQKSPTKNYAVHE